MQSALRAALALGLAAQWPHTGAGDQEYARAYVGKLVEYGLDTLRESTAIQFYDSADEQIQDADAAADETDKRSTRLALSEAGREMFAALHRHDGALAETALEGISEVERATLLALLERVRANLEAGQT